MHLNEFRHKIREYRNQVAKSQEDLAQALGLASVTLSNKLNGKNNLRLSRLEIKKIIQTLAEWKALSTQAQALELLELVDCKAHDFSSEEWHSFPLVQLETSPRLAHLLHLATPGTNTSRLHNLSVQLTSFVGRRRELEQLLKLLLPSSVTTSKLNSRQLPSTQGQSRLVSLVGPGGIGKTRLALEVAQSLLGYYPGGIWLVELASLSDASLLAQTIAAAVGLHERASQAVLTGLVGHLQATPTLLIMDNCEHLLEKSREIATYLLEKCPRLKLLVTSREGLGSPAETLFRVQPLLLPVSRKRTDPAQLDEVMEYDAVRLLVERAATTKAGFSLTIQNVPALLNICRRLDGIPLAIEMAAAHTRLLTLEQIEQRLHDCFQLLSREDSTLEPRHQTLRAVLDWSYNLLSESERVLWRRLGVFWGSWTLDAVEAICASHPLQVEQILNLLTSLVNQSLIVVEAPLIGQTSMRYRMLETIRQYGLEKLKEEEEKEGTEAAILRDRHLIYYLRLGQEVGSQVRTGATQGPALAQLESEHANFRLALAYAIRPEATPVQLEAGLTLASSLGPFWLTRGYLSEAGEWFNKLLERARMTGREDTLAYARVCAIAGIHAQERGEYEVALSLLEQSVADLNDFGDKITLAQAYGGLGILNARKSNYELSKSLFQEALTLQREGEDQVGVAYSLNNLSNIAQYQGEYHLAQLYQQESLALRRKLRDKIGIYQSLTNLGALNFFEGDYATARRHWLESLSMQRELQDKAHTAATLSNLGVIANFRREFEEAHRFHEESLALRRELGDKLGVATSLSNLGMLALLEQDYGKAQTLLHESLSLRQELDNKAGIAKSLNDLGLVSLFLKDLKAAQTFLQESLSIRHQIGDKAGLAETLSIMGSLAYEQALGCKGEEARAGLQRASYLLGATQALLKSTHRVLDLLTRETYEQTFSCLCAELGEAGFTSLINAGEAMSPEEIANYALEGSRKKLDVRS